MRTVSGSESFARSATWPFSTTSLVLCSRPFARSRFSPCSRYNMVRPRLFVLRGRSLRIGEITAGPRGHLAIGSHGEARHQPSQCMKSEANNSIANHALRLHCLDETGL